MNKFERFIAYLAGFCMLFGFIYVIITFAELLGG